jgi:hypothetical protein
MKLFALPILLFFSISASAQFFEDINSPLVPLPFAVPPAFDVPPADFKSQKDFSYVDPTRLINQVELKKALQFYEFNFSKMKNPNWLTVIDFSIHASGKRLYQIDMKTGEVLALHVSVGRGSDPDGDGHADSFSNTPNSFQSSLGFYLTDDEYMGGNGRSMRLHGLSATNSNALTRYIVVHGAAYVSEEQNHAGRSHGCPALDMKFINQYIDKTKGGSLMYIFFK